MEQVAFFAGAIGALGGAWAVIALRNPFYSVLALVVHLFSLAGLFLLLHAEFVAAAQVVVYAGAVMVLYVFVAAYVGGFEEPLWDAIPGQRILAPLLGLALFIELSIAVLGTSLKSLGTEGPTIPLGFGSPEAMGKLLLEQFLIPFEAASLLLLIAAVGAVVLAARRPALEPAGPGGPATEADRPGSPPAGGDRWDQKAREAAAADLAPDLEGRTESGPEPEIPAAVAPRAAGGRDGG
jgi:NADH-quinone oxidoreductase subunit J